MRVFLLLCVLAAAVMQTLGFQLRSTRSMASTRSLKMEYIPDGLTKAQWAAIKKKEEDEVSLLRCWCWDPPGS